jgi:hypothetical protein
MERNRKDKMPEANILIGTPAYAGQVHVDYVHALLSFYRAGVRFSLMTVDKESLITRARNAIISQFAALTDYSHLLFLDGDVYLDGEAVKRLLDHDKDVVGAPVPLKGTDEQGKQLYNAGQALAQEGDLVISDRIGTAVLLLSRTAVDALIHDAREADRIYSASPSHVQSNQSHVSQYDVFQVGVVDGQYLSEDYWVCHRLRELGFGIHVDPAIRVRHHGPAVFTAD